MGYGNDDTESANSSIRNEEEKHSDKLNDLNRFGSRLGPLAINELSLQHFRTK